MARKRAGLLIDFDLIENPKYQDLDTRAAILYSLYADRSSASLHNAQRGNKAFYDAKGVFIRFSNELAAKIIRVSEKTIGKFRKQLVDTGLIEIVRDGLEGYKIYVKEIQETPADVELLMPWKNHNIQIKKTVSDWTITALIEKAKNMATNTVAIVKEESSTTCQKKTPISLSQSNLSQSFNNNIDLIDNVPAHVRENKSNQQYKTLPEIIKSTYNAVFGFINAQVAIELHSLIDSSNVDMVKYAIEHSKDRRITSPIKYLKSVINNALAKGQKCAQDMKTFYENHFKGLKKPRNYYTDKEVAEISANDYRIFAELNPGRAAELEKARSKRVERPIIPIYKLGE
ncbi:replication protein, repA [Clostridium faecium]|uniref:Replication protein, repA n=1 Tax=Clostridium faecium TaxID=2762223 RepID=A0ABR8YTR9_9CLOT|nr:replication protein, repA [Clostridium faecium]MBD8047635.1 replication protein, repA [Clostridium faecium]